MQVTMAKVPICWLFVSFALTVCTRADTRLYFEPLTDANRQYGSVNPAKLSFASYYNDHMVLQQAKKTTIWGFADTAITGKTLTLVLSSNSGDHKSTYKTSIIPANDNGKATWSVQLSPRPAGGPYSMNVSAQGASLVLTDILFGDVWLCSGQSNMVFSVSRMFPDMALHEYNISKNYPDIRLFLVSTKGSTTPLTDLASVGLHWSLPSPKTLHGFSAVCWLFGRHLQETFNYPIGLITSAVGGTPDEAWSSPDALHKCGIKKTVPNQKMSQESLGVTDEQYEDYLDIPTQNSVLWNAMIHPLLNLTIHGTVWYQGEYDYQKSNYNCTFPAMISDWRSNFLLGTKQQTDPVFPFGFVQLGPNNPPAPGKIVAGYASIRWQQTANYGYVPNPKMPNTFMGVAVDLADFEAPGPVHYRDKETIGKRLVASGLAQAYKLPIKHTGPMPTKLSITTSTMTITYDKGETPLYIRNSWGFELCCSDTNCDYDIYGTPWVEARLISHDATSVTISTKNCKNKMSALRYNWRLSPCEYKLCAIYSVDNELPAPPIYIVKNQLTKNPNGDFTINW